MMMVAAFVKKQSTGMGTLAAVLLLVLTGVNAWQLAQLPQGEVMSLFNNMVRADRQALMFNALMTGCTFLYVLLAGRDIRRVGQSVPEYYALIFFILCGLYLLSSFNTLLMLFIGIEILSIPQYILAGSDKRSLKSSEASLKYFLLGSFSTGILLMGIALLYGEFGTFYNTGMDFATAHGSSPMAIGGLLLLIIALGFKVSAAPMHLWTPDVYDGSPTPFTAYMSTVAKAAAFYAFLRLFQNTVIGDSGTPGGGWWIVLTGLTALTLLVGNITAVFQQSVKRMLSYSSIAQAGFMLFALVSLNKMSGTALLLYAVAYSIATIGLFSILMKMKDYTFDGFNGLARKEPVLAACALIFLLSLAGIPLTGGFMAKYYMLVSVVEQGRAMWLVIFALLMAAVSVFYYFRVIQAMYFKQGEAELASPVTAADRLIVGITAALVIVLGVAPGLVTG